MNDRFLKIPAFLSTLFINFLLLNPILAQTSSSVQKVWTIGIYSGTSPFNLSEPKDIVNPVLKPNDITDVEVNILANPFIIPVKEKYYMFFAAKNGETNGQGGIALAESQDGFNWDYKQIVIDEPYHVTYPCTFKWKNKYYMTPETYTEKAVKLYQATDFPNKWEYVKPLLSGKSFVSPSIVQYKNMLWMFVGLEGNTKVCLYYAQDVQGPWKEHPQSPIVKNDLNIARPAGKPQIIEGELYRLAQDCAPAYGHHVNAFKITDISTTTYQEKMMDPPLIIADSSGWNSDAMHHVDLHQIDDNEWFSGIDANGVIP